MHKNFAGGGRQKSGSDPRSPALLQRLARSQQGQEVTLSRFQVVVRNSWPAERSATCSSVHSCPLECRNMRRRIPPGDSSCADRALPRTITGLPSSLFAATVLAQHCCHVVVVIFRREVQGRAAVVVPGIDVGATC